MKKLILIMAILVSQTQIFCASQEVKFATISDSFLRWQAAPSEMSKELKCVFCIPTMWQLYRLDEKTPADQVNVIESKLYSVIGSCKKENDNNAFQASVFSQLLSELTRDDSQKRTAIIANVTAAKQSNPEFPKIVLGRVQKNLKREDIK